MQFLKRSLPKVAISWRKPYRAITSNIDFLNVIKEAGRFSLIDRNPETQTLDIHRLVQKVVKEMMDDDTQRLWAERIVHTVNTAFSSVEFRLAKM